VALARVDHGFDGENHPGFENHPSAGIAVVQHLWLFVEDLADAVAAVLAHHGEVVGLGVFLDGVADIAQVNAGFHQLNAQHHAFVADAAQALGENGRLADEEHLAGITVVAVFDDGDVDIDDVAVFQLFITGNAVADLVVHRGADGFGEAVVVERGGNGQLLVDRVIVANLVQFVGGDAGLDMWGDHA